MRVIYNPVGKQDICGIKCSTRIVDDYEAEDYLSKGWFLNPWDMTKEDKKETDSAKLTHEEAKFYLGKHGVEYPSGLHWKKVISLAEDHANGNGNN